VRRFQSIVHFPMPGAEQREAIWRKTVPRQIELADDVVWGEVARRHELSGAAILNVSYYCALAILASGRHRLDRARLEAGILREYIKEGKVV
jgi:SpoVK/Ycf46/Vps4 family AAA+-type ATPase